MNFFNSGQNPHILMLGLGMFDDYVGGISAYQTNLTRQLLKRGYQVSVMIPKSHASKADWEEKEGVSIYRYGSARGTFFHLLDQLTAAQKTLRQILTTQKIDLLNIHFALSAWGALKLPEVKDIPKVMCFHGPWPLEWREEKLAGRANLDWVSQGINGLQRSIEKSVATQMDDIILMSHAFESVLTQDYKIPPDKVHVVPIGWDEQALQPVSLSRQASREVLDIAPDEKVLLSVRRLVHRTGNDMLIEAVAPLAKTHPDLVVYIGGKGPEADRLQQQAAALGIAGQVRFLGFIPDDQLPLYYRAADLSCVPTRSLEGFGTILLESLIQGTPVIATPVGGMVEVLGGRFPQLLTEHVSVDALRAKIAAWLTGNLNLPDEPTCRQTVTESYQWDNIFPQIERIFRKHLT